MNNWAPIISCSKVQDRLNWMLGYHTSAFHTVMCYFGDVLLGRISNKCKPQFNYIQVWLEGLQFI